MTLRMVETSHVNHCGEMSWSRDSLEVLPCDLDSACVCSDVVLRRENTQLNCLKNSQVLKSPVLFIWNTLWNEDLSFWCWHSNSVHISIIHPQWSQVWSGKLHKYILITNLICSAAHSKKYTAWETLWKRGHVCITWLKDHEGVGTITTINIWKVSTSRSWFYTQMSAQCFHWLAVL